MNPKNFKRLFFEPIQAATLSHSAAAEIFNKDEARTDWHDETLWFVREKRDKAVKQISEWEQLRTLGSDIKDHTL